MERLCALESSDGDLYVLHDLLKKFFEKYLFSFSYAAIKSKAQFSIYYPQMIKRFGQLIKTLRFEANHSFFKQSLGLTKNRKKSLKSMTGKHQMIVYMHYKKENVLRHSDPVGIHVQKKRVESFMMFHQQVALFNKLGLNTSDIVSRGGSIVYDGVKYSKEGTIALGFERNECMFGVINSVIFWNGRTYLLHERMQIQKFEVHCNSCLLKQTSRFDMCKIEDLLNHPLLDT